LKTKKLLFAILARVVYNPRRCQSQPPLLSFELGPGSSAPDAALEPV